MARGEESQKIPVTYLASQARWYLLVLALRQFFRAPGRFLWVALLTLLHHNFRSAISYFCYGLFVSERIDPQKVLHLHAHFAVGAASVAQVVSLLTDIPYSFTTHAYDIYLARKSELIYKMRYAHFVITCSVYNQRYLQRLVDPRVGERIHCVYVGLNLKLFSALIREPEKIRPPLILAVSRLVEKKGLLYLVAACRILKDQGYAFQCHIVGDGPQLPLLEERIQALHLEDCVKLPGSAAYEQVIEMYQNASIVALPSVVASDGDRDGIPYALMEAMYMRIPVVSTTVSGIPELIEDGESGLLVPPYDNVALAAALARLLDDPVLCKRLGEAARKTIEARFDVARNSETIIELFYENQPGLPVKDDVAAVAS